MQIERAARAFIERDRILARDVIERDDYVDNIVYDVGAGRFRFIDMHRNHQGTTFRISESSSCRIDGTASSSAERSPPSRASTKRSSVSADDLRPATTTCTSGPGWR
jgi:hypothetical protein